MSTTAWRGGLHKQNPSTRTSTSQAPANPASVESKQLLYGRQVKSEQSSRIASAPKSTTTKFHNDALDHTFLQSCSTATAFSPQLTDAADSTNPPRPKKKSNKPRDRSAPSDNNNSPPCLRICPPWAGTTPSSTR